jgi:hypothetical protein
VGALPRLRGAALEQGVPVDLAVVQRRAMLVATLLLLAGAAAAQ